jgi:hypothetical protein
MSLLGLNDRFKDYGYFRWKIGFAKAINARFICKVLKNHRRTNKNALQAAWPLALHKVACRAS